MKKLYLLILVFFVGLGMTSAQKVVTGMIQDEAGVPVIGANVVVKGTTVGTITDFDGKFSLSVPDDAETLVVSYTGFAGQERSIAGETVFNFILNSGEVLDEFVITGFGIKKDKKALGYAVSTIGSADISLKPEGDVGRLLRGKAPGVDITSTSGLAGSGTNIIIRGYSSITGENQPLFVVDGVPFNSSTSSDRGFTSGGATASSRFLDLDPNSIQEISILKGLSATVLYGEAGRNGVILITTKGGDISLNKGMEVSVSQSLFATKIGGIPETQKKYGNGWQNDASNAFSNWGAPFGSTEEFKTHINAITDGDGRYQLDEDGTIVHPYAFTNFSGAFPDINEDKRIPWEAKNGLADFLGGTGLMSNTSINLSQSIGESSAINFNFGYMKDKGFIPGNDYARNNLGLGFRTKLQNGLKFNSTFNFTRSDRNTPPASPIFSSNPTAGAASLFSNVLYTPVSHDLYNWPNTNPNDGSSVYYRANNGIQHPLWTLNNINDNETVDRFYGNFNLGYDITDKIGLNYRFGLDNFTQNQVYSINKGGSQVPDGGLFSSERVNTIIDQNLSLNYSQKITSDIGLDGIVGFNSRNDRNKRLFSSSTNQFIYGLQTHSNYASHSAFSRKSNENLLGAYVTAAMDYKNFLYLSVQARNDWTSTLEKKNRSVFYPSASISFVPSEIMSVPAINYLKFRLGYGTSAGYPKPYQTRTFLATDARAFNNGATVQSNSVSNQFGNSELEPERHTELEFGTEAKMFNNKVGLDLSIYNKNSNNLIIELELDPASGGTVSTINSASMNNKGIEVALTLTPYRNNDFSWDFTTNFSKNISKIVSIAEGVDKVVISGYSNLGNFAIPGQPYGVIEGTKIERDSVSGLPFIGADGRYIQSPEQGIIGDPNPDFTMNFINSFSYKGFNLRAQFDWQEGGDIWGSTASTLTARGIAGETDFDRFVPVIISGVIDNGDGTTRPNDIQVTANNAYWQTTGVWFDENRIFDATTVRLREISLSYDFPKSMMKNLPFGGMSISFAGQNLWYKALSFPESINFDPEVLSLGVGNGRGFDFVTGPTSKRYGGTLSFTF